jgi:transposase
MEGHIMITFSLKLSKQQKMILESGLRRTESEGDLTKVKRILSILMLNKGNRMAEVSDILQVSTESIRQWLKKYLIEGLRGLRSGSSPGRSSKLNKSQRRELARAIIDGPEKQGFTSSCWRAPMIQYWIKEKFGVFYNARYISELLHGMGFSFQKATFIADKRDEALRKEWVEKTWPEIQKEATRTGAYILFGDECSFPQWGTLSYTWALKGDQPVIKTSGNRKAYKVFGLIDYFTGRFFSKGHEGKLNGESYIEFLKMVLSKTRKPIILIQDGAPYHKGKLMKQFCKDHADRITLYNLPSYSPDYNPIEKLWKKIKEQGTHLKYFPTFEDLKSKVNEMLINFSDWRSEVISLFGFYDRLPA